MTHIPFSLLISVLFFGTLNLRADTKAEDTFTDADLLERVEQAAEAIPWIVSPAKHEKDLRKAFQGLNDAQIIDALALYIFRRDQDPELKMSFYTPMGISAIGKRVDLIQDYSGLRNLLRNEQDPRKFWLLCSLIPRSEKDDENDFIPEISQMLFRDGRVVKDQYEASPTYSADISIFAVDSIISTLKAREAEFEFPEDLTTHEKQALFLAKWLKENWKGCADLKLPEAP